jgi:hypothetical protein
MRRQRSAEVLRPQRPCPASAHRVEAARLILPFQAIEALGQDQEAGSAARGGRRVAREAGLAARSRNRSGAVRLYQSTRNRNLKPVVVLAAQFRRLAPPLSLRWPPHRQTTHNLWRAI